MATGLRPAGASALVYLAAAVSDYHVPPAEQAEHKIQSGAGGLTLALRPTPKRLGDVKGTWCPAGMAVSFKLETDAALLMPKAAAAVAR